MAVLVALTVVTVTLGVRNGRPSPPGTVTAPPSAGSGPAPLTGAIEPPHGTPPGTYITGRDQLVDGELRATIEPRGGRSLLAWRATSTEHRLSLSVSVRVAASPPAEVILICGTLSPGEKHLAASVDADGAWRIEANGQVMGRGAAPERRAELRETFVLRLDCVTDRSPTVATLQLNGTARGAAEGVEPFPIPFATFFAGTEGEEGFDIALSAFTVRRVG